MINKNKCALCLENTNLVKSHIYPEFQYKPLYDKAHKYFQFSTDPLKRVKKKSKGIYEYLLCSKCEKIIGAYEDHASKVMFGDKRFKIEIKKSEVGFTVLNVDYRLFKLFQISLLWRTAASIRPEIPNINLGKHYDIMRLMLLKGNPGKPLMYGTMIYFIHNLPEDSIGLIVMPEKIKGKIEGHTAYRAIFNGFPWVWLVSSHSFQHTEPMVFLNEKGELPITYSGKYGWNYFQQLKEDFGKKLADSINFKPK